MIKWFKRSLMALGAISFLLIPLAMIASSESNQILENLGIAIVLAMFLLMLSSFITGIGAAFEFARNRSTEKAKRGLIYQDEMLNRIMNRLSDEERSYLQGYLSAQSYEPVEGFDYIVDEQNQNTYK